MPEQPENEPPDEQPELKPKGRSLSVFQAWLQVLAAPSTASFYILLDDPRASLWRALRWLFLSTTLLWMGMAVINLIASGNLRLEVLPPALMFCMLISAIQLVSFAFYTLCIHLIARLLRGTGTYGELLYSFAAFFPPLYFIEIGVALLTNQPIFFIAIRVYRILLIALAVRAVHRMTWWKTIGAIVIGVVIAQHLGVVILLF